MAKKPQCGAVAADSIHSLVVVPGKTGYKRRGAVRRLRLEKRSPEA
jgi:hypothetical protein